MHDTTAKLLSQLHAAAYSATGGRLGNRLVGNDMLLLTTAGRRTQRRHTVPLLYLEEGPDRVVFASWGGRDRHPEWYLNLLADPVAQIRIGFDVIDVRARTTSDGERDELWQRAVEAYDGYATYQSRTDREIPVVVLESLTQPT